MSHGEVPLIPLTTLRYRLKKLEKDLSDFYTTLTYMLLEERDYNEQYIELWNKPHKTAADYVKLDNIIAHLDIVSDHIQKNNIKIAQVSVLQVGVLFHLSLTEARNNVST